MLRPWRITTRPSASVIQRPAWPRGSVGAACAGAAVSTSARPAAARRSAFLRMAGQTTGHARRRTPPGRGRRAAPRRRRPGPLDERERQRPGGRARRDHAHRRGPRRAHGRRRLRRRSRGRRGGGRARTDLRGRHAPRDLRALRRGRGRAHARAGRDRAVLRARRRAALRALRDAAPGRAGAHRALRRVRHARARRVGPRGARGPHCCIVGEPWNSRPRRRPGGGAAGHRAAGVGGGGVLARREHRHAARARRGRPPGRRRGRARAQLRDRSTAGGPMKAITMGVHVLDVLVRPVEAIPEGQGGALVDEIRMTAAGSAGGTALVLSRLGADVRSMGAIGADPLGDMLAGLLERDGVDTALLVRRDDVQTSASVLPIRPDGSRPAFHVVGANGAYGPDDVDWDAVAGAEYLHLGGPEFMGGEAAAAILSRAREAGVVTSADILAPGDMGLLEWIAPALEHLDYLLPNDEQVLGFTGASSLVAGCRALVERGTGCVAATCGADGAVIVDADSVERVPAFAIDVVDTTGCGDAFSAGFLRGLSLGRDRRGAAELGCATAALVAQGLGTDHGEFDLEAVEQFAASTPV